MINRIALYLLTVLSMIFLFAPASQTQGARPARRALLVGTDVYKNFPENPTPGAEEDVRETRKILIEKYGFRETEIRTLLRDEATAHNIREAFKSWLIKETRPGDRVFFLYSGHGTNVNDADGDEAKNTPGDTRDESLAPYDVGESSDSVIIDDELSLLINQLSGRMSVLVFDSCFSGTVSRGSRDKAADGSQAIARYLPPLEDMKSLVTRSGGKGIADDYRISPSSGSRGLTVVDKEAIKTTGVVIFSAAQPHQLAYSIPVRPDYYRGAFSYLLDQYMENSRTTLRDLKSSLVSGMEGLYRKKMLRPDQQQYPYFEFFPVPLENQPLFGETLTAPAVALSNPVSTITLTIRTLEGKKENIYYFGTVGGKPYNESVSYEVQTSEPGYLYLIVFSTGDPVDTDDDVATRIFPNADQKDNRVEKGAHKIFRDPVTREGFLVTEPAGRDVVIALLCSSKLNFGQENGYEKENYKWAEVFDLLKSKRFSEQVETLTRGQSGKGQTASPTLDMMKWQTASVVVEARKLDK